MCMSEWIELYMQLSGFRKFLINMRELISLFRVLFVPSLHPCEFGTPSLIFRNELIYWVRGSFSLLSIN